MTQCLIGPAVNGTIVGVVYRVRATLVGTYWYHGLYHEQYVDGLIGPLIVNGVPDLNGALYTSEWIWTAYDWCDPVPSFIYPALFSAQFCKKNPISIPHPFPHTRLGLKLPAPAHPGVLPTSLVGPAAVPCQARPVRAGLSGTTPTL